MEPAARIGGSVYAAVTTANVDGEARTAQLRATAEGSAHQYRSFRTSTSAEARLIAQPAHTISRGVSTGPVRIRGSTSGLPLRSPDLAGALLQGQAPARNGFPRSHTSHSRAGR
jgi:hypothetical protein